MADNSDGEKEEGEIEDGEIVDSQEDDEGGLGNGNFVSKTSSSMNGCGNRKNVDWNTVHVMDDGIGIIVSSTTNKKNKKKKKKKKKRPLGQLLEEELGSALPSMTSDANNDAAMPKAKKQRKFYVDHDRVEDEDPFFRSNSPPSFQRGRRSSDPYTTSMSPPRGRDSPSSYRRSSPPLQQLQQQSLPPQPQPLQTRRSRSPPGLYDSPYESDEDYNGPGVPLPPLSGANGRYDDGCMGGGDLLGDSGRMMGNGTGKNRRKGRRGENGRQGGGGGRKKRKQRPPAAICKFYQDGKCSKGDECTFKHDGSVPKKLELCKFYLNGFCAKADGCIYLHSEYPCKFFHTGVKCYSADKCRFSHEPLTDETRQLLEKCLDKDEDEMMADVLPQKHFRPSLLGTPPNRGGGGGSVHEALKGIPSLFDIEVSMPVSLQQQQQQQHHHHHQQQQNMSPPSHQHEEDHHQMGPNIPFYAETMNNGSPPRMPTKTPLLPLPFCGNRSQRGHQGYPDDDDDDDNEHDMYQSAMGMMDVDDRIASGGGGMDPYMSNGGESMDTDLRTMLPGNCSNDGGDRAMFSSRPWHITAVDVDMRGRRMMENDDVDWDSKKDQQQQSDQEKGRSSDSESECGGTKKTDATGPIQIPIHLPKKQRELFLRIQQQQRAAAATSNQKNSENKDLKRKLDGDEAERGDLTEEMDKNNNGEVEFEDEEEREVLKVEKEDEDDDDRDFEKRRDEEENDDYDDDDDDKGMNEAKVEIGEQQQEEKEKWYSSDDDDEDEDQPLTAVLKKLQQQPIQKVEPQKAPNQPQPAATAGAPFSTTSIFDIAKMIQSITNQSSQNTKTANSNAKTVTEASTVDSRPRTSAPSRDPRSQKQNSASVAEPRDPRAARNNIETHEHIHKSFFRDPRMLHRERTATNNKDLLSSSHPSSKKEPKVPRPSSPDRTVDGSNPNSITYRVHTAIVSRPDYARIAITSNMDPRRVIADPRLKRHVADDPRFSRYVVVGGSPHSSSDEGDRKKKGKETSSSIRNFAASSKVAAKSGSGTNKPVAAAANARPGLHRLGVVTMPGPLRDESLLKGGNSLLDSRKGEDEEYSLSDLDDIVKKPSAFPRRRLSRDASIEVIRSPAREGGFTKEPIVGKRSLGKVEERDTLREIGSFTPPLNELRIQELPAKIKGGSCNRKSSMDYASPLGGYDIGDGGTEHSEGGYVSYQKRPPRTKPIAASSTDSSSSSSSAVSIPKDLLEPPKSSPPPPIGIMSLPTPMLDCSSSSDEALVIDNASLKDIFKTIDPTASPFC